MHNRPDLILTVNSGSTSVKLAAFRAAGLQLERIGSQRHDLGDDASADPAPESLLQKFVDHTIPDGGTLRAVCHRVVHGGSRFVEPVVLDGKAESALAELSELAPLHNPPALRWIAAARRTCPPQTPHVAVFDTAFFAALPAVASRYAIEPQLAETHLVRRYGFHGIAHEDMWRQWRAAHPEIPGGGRLISLQLGGGCSMTAVREGRPIDTSMGFSPLEGLVMATRSGDIDLAVVDWLARRLGEPAGQIVERLNRQSGLLGVSGRSSAIGELLAEGSPAAMEAVELYCYRARKYLGAYLAALGGCDGVAFGGGVGEHVPEVRARILEGMEWAGIRLDARANANARGGGARLDPGTDKVRIHVFAVDEEAALARAALELTADR